MTLIVRPPLTHVIVFLAFKGRTLLGEGDGEGDGAGGPAAH